jgi:hypothetical protein
LETTIVELIDTEPGKGDEMQMKGDGRFIFEDELKLCQDEKIAVPGNRGWKLLPQFG